MEALTSYGRPFHQRGVDMPIGPLNPADVAAMTGLDPAAAFDATLVTGGLPIICARWERGEDVWSFLARELANPVSPLTASAQLSLAAQFPDQAQARAVLAAIGSGERTFTNIARAGGGIAHSTLTRAAELLIDKRIVVGDLPVSTHPSKERRYRITDSYLRFWFAFLGSVKWLENSPFDNRDLVALQHHRDRLTGDPIPLIAVTRSGASTDRLDAVFGPDELLEPWLG
jgi:hypothetical protein